MTIPAPIRTRLGLGEGDLVEVAIRPLHKKEEVNRMGMEDLIEVKNMEMEKLPKGKQ
ncbi:MAG: hypothetical protein WBH62_08260 [Methanothermobacter tenebrarum]